MTSQRHDRQRPPRRRPLCAIAAAMLMAIPAEGLTTTPRRSTRLAMSADKRTSSGSLAEPSFEFVPNARRTRPEEAAVTPLRMICDEQHEFELNLGKAVDTLKQDYPDILTDDLDYSIYDQDLEVVDPSGVTLHGLTNYKNAFRLVHTIINLFYCPEQSLLTFRLVYDWARNQIRVSWNAEVVPKAIFGGTKTTLHVDGISVYVVDRTTGKIVQHRVEHLMLNDSPVAPERGIIHALKNEVIDPDCIPAFNTDGVLRFQQINPVNFFMGERSPTSLFSMSLLGKEDGGLDGKSNHPKLDWEAFERKNATRKKFGLEPLTPEEFEEVEAKVKKLEMQQQQQLQQQRAASSSAGEYPQKKQKPGILNKLFGNMLEDTCESNFDCRRPQVCCDFGFTKKCCSSGMMVVDGPRITGERATVPVVAGYPPGMGPESPEYY